MPRRNLVRLDYFAEPLKIDAPAGAANLRPTCDDFSGINQPAQQSADPAWHTGSATRNPQQSGCLVDKLTHAGRWRRLDFRGIARVSVTVVWHVGALRLRSCDDLGSSAGRADTRHTHVQSFLAWERIEADRLPTTIS